MTTPEADRLRDALEAVGRLTAAQAAHLLGCPPQAAGRRLQSLVDQGATVRFQGAYWHPRCPRRGARHRELVADLYVALSPLFSHWTFTSGGPGRYRPDGWLVSAAGGLRVAVEADRGTETAAQWREKARRMGTEALDGLIVAAPTAARARRVAAWAAPELACPILSAAAGELDPDCTGDWLARLHPAPAAAASAACLPRRLEYWRGDVPWEGRVPAPLPPGSGTERLAGCDRVHLPASPSPRGILGRLAIRRRHVGWHGAQTFPWRRR